VFKPWVINSGTGTNLKVGAPVWRESGGTDPARSNVKKFFGRAPPLFGSKSTSSCFGERIRDGITVLSVTCLLFFYTRGAPRAQQFAKSRGGARAPFPMESAPLMIIRKFKFKSKSCGQL